MTSAFHPAPHPKPHRSYGVLLFFLILGVTVYGLMLQRAYDIRGKYVTETVSSFGQLPSAGVQAASLEFKGVVSDYLFFKTMTFLGMKVGERQNPSSSEWGVIHDMLQKVTDLDPKFWDPYVFAEMILVWQAGMFDEANVLLEKAALNRPEDYRPDYYIGFNYLYFKKDSKSAAPHLRKAAEFTNAPEFLKGLASRVSLYAGETGVGIFFLESIIKDTEDPWLAKYLEKRLAAMKTIFFLEQRIKEYQDKIGSMPKSPEDLVSEGLITEIPEDPYGGEFVFLENGRVYTTSEMIDKNQD